jgi:hypothetical protein
MTILLEDKNRREFVIRIINDKSTRPTTISVYNFFLAKLRIDPNNMTILEDLVRAGECGDIPQYAINALLDKIYPKEVK